MTRFTSEVLTNFGLHISQVNGLGLPRITYFEFICRANRIEPTFEKFNLFYFVSYTGGFYSFNSRNSGVSPCSSHQPKSIHDWKQKFFYIRRGVIPIDMHYRAESEGVPLVNVLVDFVAQYWYKVLTKKVIPIIQLEEKALVAAGMTGYNLMNVFDPKAGGAMVVAILPEGRPLWLDQIRNNFLHPTGESMATYANVVLGADHSDDIDVDSVPAREDIIVLSSEGSDGSHEGLIRRSTRAETQKKRRGDKAEEKKVEEKWLRKQRLRHLFQCRRKQSERDPDDDATLTEIMKEKNILEDKKKELDEQVAAALAEKKSKLKKETTTAPSELEVYLGVFSAKAGILLEKMYKSAFGSRGLKPGKGVRKVDVSKITPPTSPPSRNFNLSPPRPDPREKGEGHDVEVEQVRENIVAGASGDGGRKDGAETEVESSETTPHATIYTKRPPGSGGGCTSGIRQSQEFLTVQAGPGIPTILHVMIFHMLIVGTSLRALA
ncbi:hypothetical protein Hanom_Chr05g00436421 [Helianthus anomalus]